VKLTVLKFNFKMNKFNCTKSIKYFTNCPQIIWEDCDIDEQIDLCPMDGSIGPPCPIWTCSRNKQAASTGFNVWILIGILIAALIFTMLMGLAVWKCKKRRRQAQQHDTFVRYRHLQGYQERLLDEPQYNLTEDYEAEINQRKKPE
jgi:hypothetical protein